MTPFPHQIKLAQLVTEVLKANGIAYLAAEERTGKTLASIIACDDINKAMLRLPSKKFKVLVITKKKALDGWNDTLKAYPHKSSFTVTNYHQAHKQGDDYDLIILDEAHNYISSFPKPSAMWKGLRELCAKKPIIYLSATPNAQGPQQLYHQFALSSYSPWRKYPNFYSWFKTFGKPYTLEINGIAINQYDRCDKDLVFGTVEHLFITKTRKELGFEHEPEDELHYITLSDNTRAVYNELLEHNIIELKAGWLVCDTKPKLRFSLHMLEGGVAKIEDQNIVLANCEKVDYIKAVFGDTEDLVIMYNYIAEGDKLSQAFKHAKILQATSFAEGVDLSMHKDLVIYSQDFSTARHTQRRARQANKNRKEPITVHYLLVKKGLSEQVYKTVSVNKKNFVDTTFTRSKI